MKVKQQKDGLLIEPETDFERAALVRFEPGEIRLITQTEQPTVRGLKIEGAWHLKPAGGGE
jgi:hypothetical protein